MFSHWHSNRDTLIGSPLASTFVSPIPCDGKPHPSHDRPAAIRWLW
jgi:hypothetical protein